MSGILLNLFLFGLSGSLFGYGSRFPETTVCVASSVISIFLLTISVRLSTKIKTGLYVWCIVFTLAAFYWIPQTLVYFGGFPYWVSVILFVLYCFLSSLQFVLCGWLYERFRVVGNNRLLLAFPAAWLVCEYIWFRMFPWHLAHPFVGWESFSTLAEFVGIAPLSFLLLWWSEGLVSLLVSIRLKSFQIPRNTCLLLLSSLLLLVLGTWHTRNVERQIESAPKVNAGIVQGNLEAKQKGDLKYFDVNVETYRRLSREAEAKGAELLIWPEAVIEMWTPEYISNLRETKVDPDPNQTIPLIYGTLSYRRQGNEVKRFNTAVALGSLGQVLGMYHKQVLMPLGEYMPFADIIPALKELSPQTGEFSFGDRDPVVNVSLKGQSNEAVNSIGIGLLICYEDLVPRLSRQAVEKGAQVLVNLTNDAWYGDTSAPVQHHLLSMWRAIETRRFLVRATNTGFTGVVSPLGHTEAKLSVFSEGTLNVAIPLLSGTSLFVRYGQGVKYLLLALCFGYLVAGWQKKREETHQKGASIKIEGS